MKSLWSPILVATAVCLPLSSCDRGPERAATTEVRAESQLGADSAAGWRSSTSAEPYEFSTDWFSDNIRVWEEVLEPYRGKPDIRYLEIGVFEGMSLLWMLEHVLTHPSCRLTGIDIEISETLLANLERSGQADRVTLIRGSSRQELRTLPPVSFDVIYIDGSHTADDVLADAVLSWELLKTGGLLIFDDYRWPGTYYAGSGPLPAELVPRSAVEWFVEAYRNEIREVHRGYQMILRKEENPCDAIKSHCSRLGQYIYDWQQHQLLIPGAMTTVRISDRERELIERILRSGSVDELTRSNDTYVRLRDRLKLDDR